MRTTLPARFYTDPAHFRREVEHFFFGKWICAGRADQIPERGDYFLRDILGESIIVTRDASGAVNAMYNVTTCAAIAARASASQRAEFFPARSSALITRGRTTSADA
jgi:hypothetical protein